MTKTYTLLDDLGGMISLDGDTVRAAAGLAVGSYDVQIKVEETFHVPMTVAAGAGAANRYMFFATRARMPSGSLHTVIAGTEYKCCKIVVSTPSYPVNDFRFHFSGFASTEGGNSPQETVVPSGSMIIDRAVLRVGGIPHELKFGGAAGVTIASGALGAWADALLLDQAVAAESDVELWTFYHNTAGATQVPVYRIQKHRGERIWGGSTLAEVEAYLDTPLADSHPSLDVRYETVGNDTTGQPQFYGPDFMVAKGWDGRPVALCTADSIGEARQEIAMTADARGNLGWLRRWLDTKGGIGRIPHLMIGMPGAAARRELTGSGATIATRRWDVLDQIIAFNGGLRPFTVVLDQMGFNDSNATSATWLGYITGLADRIVARYPGIKIVKSTITGRSTSTDGYTAAAQTVVSPFGQPRRDVNAGLKASAKYVATLDIAAAWADASNADYWQYATSRIGTLISTGGNGDGVTVWTTATSDVPLVAGQLYSFEYQPGLWAGRTVKSCAGTGPYIVEFIEAYATIFQSNAEIRLRPTPDGVHPSASYVADMVAGLPQSEKVKLVA